eukprot:583046-Prorocentrum_minimum.AAC.1
MLAPLLRSLAPDPRTCSLPSFDWPLVERVRRGGRVAGNFKAAIADFSAVLQLDLNNANAYFNRGS